MILFLRPYRVDYYSTRSALFRVFRRYGAVISASTTMIHPADATVLRPPWAPADWIAWPPIAEPMEAPTFEAVTIQAIDSVSLDPGTACETMVMTLVAVGEKAEPVIKTVTINQKSPGTKGRTEQPTPRKMTPNR